MTSEIEVLKSNEFLRRRKLRLQQVREQSKDIAKRIRQRAKAEQLMQVVDLDVKKQKEYLERQGELVKKLEDLYTKGVTNFGASHKDAVETRYQVLPEKVDLSKLRGREAAAELKRKKQEILDDKKKLLDRKLQAREAANELSREKSTSVAKKISKKDTEDTQVKAAINPEDSSNKNSENVDTDKNKPVTNDMATQWDFEGLPNEWELNVPALSIPKDDSAKETNNNIETKSDRSKRLDLFALSEEMPTSLRGGLTNVGNRIPVKPSLTLVSEYLQSRGMRLRETETPNKRQAEDLQSIKQTILRTRSSKPEVSVKSNTEKLTKPAAPDIGLTRKSSVTVYNHSTRNTRDVPTHDERLVVREDQSKEDAYSQAMKESTIDNDKDREQQKRIQDMRNKVAMTKQSIEKEYKDTINFLNSLPKDTNSRPIYKAYKDENRQQVQKENHQRKMQQRYKQIERECKKHSCTKSRTKSKSPIKNDANDLDGRDFQYSWMPVPESDGNLAIHTIPNTFKDGKSHNTVKFTKVDSYHEYRSRHKHTPPTKDTIGREKHTDRKVEAVIIDNNSTNSTEYSSASSVENISLVDRDPKSTIRELSDAERIIIYKILDSKNKRKCKKKAKLLKNVSKSPASLNKTDIANDGQNTHDKKIGDETENRVSIEQLTEGVYKTVNEKGDNITSMYFSDNQHNREKSILTPGETHNGHTCCCNKVISKEQQQNQGTMNIQWETGEPTTRKSNTYVGCKCKYTLQSKPEENVKTSVVQPSAATSTSSFKMANVDKSSNALPDCGYVKLIDDGGQEAGKFYIGASGFLKDDAYEVVIQLRKKDGSDKVDNKESVDTPNNKRKNKTNEVIQSDAIQATEALNNLLVKSTDGDEIKVDSKASQKSDTVVLSTRESCVNTDSDNTPLEPIISENVNNHPKTKSAEINTNPSKNLVDKAVHTSFPVSDGIPSHAPLTNPSLKAATSTYTQTSINSPNHRPVYFHMSSSTSTAYMSPPEYVLPKFLRQDSRMVDDELFPPTEDFTDEAELSDQQYNEEYDKCKCKRCIHARNIVLTKTKTPFCCKKRSKLRLSKLDTPPNTVRTCSTEHGVGVYDDKRKHVNRNCRKFMRQPGSETSKKSYNEKNKYLMTANKKLSQHCKTGDPVPSTLKYKQSNSTKTHSKHHLNPAIKGYVNKLLSLNKEGIKVVEVADQECSSITTPTSSIINDSKNIDKNKPVQSSMSLEQIKSMLKLQILEEYIKKKQDSVSCAVLHNKKQHHSNLKNPRVSRRKQVHKVKSLNISKNILKTKSSSCDTKQSFNNNTSSTSSAKEINDQPVTTVDDKTNSRSKSLPTPRHVDSANVKPNPSNNTSKVKIIKPTINAYNPKSVVDQKKTKLLQNRDTFTFPNNRASKTSNTTTSTDSENSIVSKMQQRNAEIPITLSTQTSQNSDKEINYMKVAENKLQNMEKIADLTEKCTKRLSNLARVLDEVRRNKTLAYSQISSSDTASDSDQKSDKQFPNMKLLQKINDSVVDAPKIPERRSPSVPIAEKVNENYPSPDSTDFVPFLSNIPKPNVSKTSDYNLEPPKSVPNLFIPVINTDNYESKTKTKPPPALSRIQLRNGQEPVIPHELSTVLEVDSPVSLKLKTTSSRDTKDDETGSNPSSTNLNKKSNDVERHATKDKEPFVNPDLLQSNIDVQQSKISLTESSDDSKLQMMDLNQFNQIMLKPFITFKEHAKRCNIVINEGSNLEDNPKGIATDDISSLHSDGSLPDVVAELLKRNIISEPFKYDTASNVNSTTISSESTLSVLALSKVKRKKHSGVTFHNKESIGESSDSLSVSSNPDLENAFKKLGMGWASSTLKKTKERLALSSSSNTSSASLSQYKLKNFNNQDIPALVTNSVSTILNLSKKPGKERNVISDNKNAEQQTSLTNSMTVKEFLTNELANKITFTNKSHRDDTEEEFVSLFETKMPENMKNISLATEEERSGNSGNSASNNRARTSTPVQVFKSMTYHSSSSSNMSNGLFSNADDLSSVKATSNSKKNNSTSDKDDLTVPNLSLKLKKSLSDCSKSE